MRKLACFVLALAVAVPLAVAGEARADHCFNPDGSEHNIVIFSYTAGTLAVNSNALVCILAPQETEDLGYDGRLINPGSTAISVRYVQDFGSSVNRLQAVLDGLGYNNQSITLNRRQLATGGFVYDSEVLPIDPLATGRITATVTLPDESTESNTFHTLGS